MTQARDIRLLALWRDDRTEAPLTVDLRMDSDGRILSGWDVFGAVDLDGANCRPFVLRRDGTMDFGAGAGGHWRSELRSVRVKVGSRFLVHWNDADSGEYEIVKVAVLGGKDRSS